MRYAPHLLMPDAPGESWSFNYTREEILKAAKRRAIWHRQRLTHWRKQFAALKKKLPSTITIENQEWMNKAASNSSYGRAELAIEPKLTRDFQQCVNKVGEHQKLAEEFERWVAIFTHAAATGSRQAAPGLFACTIIDIKYFGLHDADRYTAKKETEEQSG